jgi:hypothetical protein
LTSSQGTDHDQPRTHTGEEALCTELTSHGDESGSGRLSWETLALVDFGQESVGGLRDNGSGHTGDETSRQVETGRLTTGERVLGFTGELEDLLGRNLEAERKRVVQIFSIPPCST